jgi:hypothetical protein
LYIDVLFQPSLAHGLPSPWADLLHPDPTVLAVESSRWNATYGRPPVHSKHESHYEGSTFIPEAEDDDDFHREDDIVFIAFYAMGEVRPKATTRNEKTYEPKWAVHHVPQYVARFARVQKLKSAGKRKAEDSELDGTGVTARTLRKWEDTIAGPSSPKKVKRGDLQFP